MNDTKLLPSQPVLKMNSKFYEKPLPEWEDGVGFIFNAIFWFDGNDRDENYAHGYGNGPHGPYMWVYDRTRATLSIICADRRYTVTQYCAECELSGETMISHSSVLEPFLIDGKIRWADTRHIQVTPVYPMAAPLRLSIMFEQFSDAVIGRCNMPGTLFGYEKKALLEVVSGDVFHRAQMGVDNIPVNEAEAEAYVKMRLAAESFVNNGLDELSLVRGLESFLETALKFPRADITQMVDDLRPQGEDPVTTDSGRVLFPIFGVGQELLAILMSGQRCSESQLSDISEKARKHVAETKAALKKQKAGQ